MLAEREICYKLFESDVFLFHLARPAELPDSQIRILLIRGIKGLFGNPELSTSISNRGLTFGLPGAGATCSLENRDRFIDPLLSSRRAEAAILL